MRYDPSSTYWKMQHSEPYTEWTNVFSLFPKRIDGKLCWRYKKRIRRYFDIIFSNWDEFFIEYEAI